MGVERTDRIAMPAYPNFVQLVYTCCKWRIISWSALYWPLLATWRYQIRTITWQLKWVKRQVEQQQTSAVIDEQIRTPHHTYLITRANNKEVKSVEVPVPYAGCVNTVPHCLVRRPVPRVVTWRHGLSAEQLVADEVLYQRLHVGSMDDASTGQLFHFGNNAPVGWKTTRHQLSKDRA